MTAVYDDTAFLYRFHSFLLQNGPADYRTLAKRLAAETGWNRNTTYTVIKNTGGEAGDRAAGARVVCHALVTKAEVQQREAESLLEKLFDGSPSLLFSAFVGGQKQLPPELVEMVMETQK